MSDYEASPVVERAMERATEVARAVAAGQFGEEVPGIVDEGVAERGASMAMGVPADDLQALAWGRVGQMLQAICDGAPLPPVLAGTATQMLMLGWFIRDEQAREQAAEQ